MTPTTLLLLVLLDPLPAVAPMTGTERPDPGNPVAESSQPRDGNPTESEPVTQPEPAAQPEPTATPGIEVESVLLTLIEQREVPASEAGALSAMSVTEGMLVQPDTEVARIDNRDVLIAAKRMEVDLSIARERAKNELDIEIAQKSLELAQDAVDRAEAARRSVERSVTEADLRQKRLARDVANLEVDKANKLLALERLNVQLKEAELEATQRAVERRRIITPIGGKVVQIHRRKGDWVEPGTPVLRILRMDTLRAEAFLPANIATPALEGRAVTVHVDVPGETGVKYTAEVAFVSPEINEVDGQVRVWVDVANPKLDLRPGQRVRMTIHPAETAARVEG